VPFLDPTGTPYQVRFKTGDAFNEGGLSDVTGDGTFQYPEAVNLRRTPGISAIGMSMLPFRISWQAMHVGVPKKQAYTR